MIDAETRLSVRLASMQAWCAMHGREDVKLKSASEAYEKIYFDALSTIPYLTGGRSYADSKALDVENLRKQYAEFRAAIDNRKKVEA